MAPHLVSTEDDTVSLLLDRTSRRIIGVLLEKEATTPNGYPLSLNALLNGCCQKSNRDPVMDLQEFELEGALRSLQVNGWVANVREAGSRVEKWRHKAEEKLDTSPEETSVLCELLLRGAQQPGELRSRTNRLQGFSDMETLMGCVNGLIERGLVRRISRRAGERAERFDHCLYPEDEVADSPAADVFQTTEPTSPVPATSNTEWLDRIERLEEQVQHLQTRLDELCG